MTHPHELRIEADDVADEDRFVELHLTHRPGDVAMCSNGAGLNRRGQVDVREDDAAEDGSVRVGVLRQKQHLDGGDSGRRHDRSLLITTPARESYASERLNPFIMLRA